MKQLLCLVLSACCALAQANGLQSLERFAARVQSGQAAFTQTVTAPSRAGSPARVKISSGTFAFLRPGRFRFDYAQPFAQTLVADGETLWMYDHDLQQVTARKQASALGNTPAALIASAPDLRALQSQFVLIAAPDANGLQWVQATPLATDGQLRSVRMGFRLAADATGQALPTLEVLQIDDSFGQRSVLTFAQFQVNPSLSSADFRFTPPAGVDVLQQ